MFKALKQKIAGFIHKPPAVVKPKEFVPFDLIIGSPVKLDTNLHIIYKSLCDLRSSYTVTGIGKCTLGDSKIFRFYFGNDYFLQVITNLANQIEESRFFSLIDTVFPSTMQAWGTWLAKNTGRIGAFEFNLDTKDITYIRMSSWADDDPPWVPPVTFTEQLYTGAVSTRIVHQAMAYGRWLNENKRIAEYLLVSSDSSETSELVRLYVGIDINPNEVITRF